MSLSVMKSNLYKIIDSLPETSLKKAKKALEDLLSKRVTDESGMTAEDELWLSEGRKDAVKALSAIESEFSDKELDEYLDSFKANERPIKWDKRRKTFVFLDVKP